MCMEDIEPETPSMVEDTPIAYFTPSKKDQTDKTQEIKRRSPRYPHKKKDKQNKIHDIGTLVVETPITESTSSSSIQRKRRRLVVSESSQSVELNINDSKL